MVVHTTLSTVSCVAPTAGDVPAFPAFIGASDTAASATSSVSASANAPVANSYTRWTYNYVNLSGTVLNRTSAVPSNFVRYCEYPGQRLFKQVRFDVNGNPLTV
jgi:hypothetical protein